MYPIDPVGGGTWAGVNESGLAAALLNRTVDSAASPRLPLSSRGLIIPNLLGGRSLMEALDIGAGLDPAQFDQFRVILVQNKTAAVITSDGTALSVETMDVQRPLMLTSSSLGDAVVDAPRRRLFEQLVLENPGSYLSAQTRFHAHRWPSRTEISVSMARADARTVSRTIIDVGSDTIELQYDPLGSGPPTMLHLDTHSGEVQLLQWT